MIAYRLLHPQEPPQLQEVPSKCRKAWRSKTLLLQSQLDYIQARDELTEAMGITPE
jgi:hypothetical protein